MKLPSIEFLVICRITVDICEAKSANNTGEARGVIDAYFFENEMGNAGTAIGINRKLLM